MKVGVKFCGGCNPRYDRGGLLRKIKEDPSHDIYLVCYCQNFERCHLKILKSIIEYL